MNIGDRVAVSLRMPVLLPIPRGGLRAWSCCTRNGSRWGYSLTRLRGGRSVWALLTVRVFV